jgi:SAM-dependent methyltransferase
MAPMTLSRQRHALLVQCLADRAEPVAKSPRFTIYHLNPDPADAAGDLDDIIVVHDFAPAEIDNNIARHVADELLPLLVADAPRPVARDGYGATDQEVFERFVGEIVRSVDGNERRAWHLFYDNTLAALDRAGRETGAAKGQIDRLQDLPRDYIADFAAIYRRAIDLADEIKPASILDVATCFGFFPLLLASGAWPATGDRQERPRIVGCDLNPALVSLARSYVRQRKLTGIRFVEADILGIPPGRAALPEPSFDVVTAIHLLEHLEPAQTAAAMDGLWSLARRRLIVAVPVEAVADTRFGHRQIFDGESLAALGRITAGSSRCFEDHGAWLVIDRVEEMCVGNQTRNGEGRT